MSFFPRDEKLSVAALCAGAALLAVAALFLNGADPKAIINSPAATAASVLSLFDSGANAAAVVTYTTPSTYQWTAPAGVNGVLISVIGGGGGGSSGAWSEGSCAGDAGNGGAGGSGGYISNQAVAVTPGQTYNIVVGAGGAGGPRTCGYTRNNAYPGGNSSFGGVVAAGGGAGVWYAGGAGGSPGGNSGTGGAWYCNTTVPGSNGSGYGDGGRSNCGWSGASGLAGAVFVNNPLSFTATPASVAYNGTSALTYAAATASAGTHLYVGLVANCNAGIVTTDPNYKNCATRSIGYTTGASGGTALYGRSASGGSSTCVAGAVKTNPDYCAPQSIGYTTNTAGGEALYVGTVSWCNAGIVSTDANYRNCYGGNPDGGLGSSRGGATTQAIGYTSSSAGGYDACYLSGGQWTGSGIAVGTSGSTNTNGLISNTTYSYTCHDMSFGWVGPVSATVAVGPQQPACTGAHEVNPPACTCEDGYVRQNGVCVLPNSCPGVHEVNPPACTCEQGYVRQNGVCVLPTNQCPGVHEVNPPACTCEQGYVRQNGVCVLPVLPPPTFTAIPNATLPGQAVTLSWNCPNPPYTESQGDSHYSTKGALSGNATVNPTNTTTYNLYCKFGNSQTSRSATVTVAQPDLSITAAPARVQKGKTSTVSWTAANVTAGSCRVSGTDGASWAGASGSRTPTITAPTIYTLACSVPSGEISTSVTVGIVPVFQEI